MVTNRPNNRLRILARHDLLCYALVQNARTGRWRLVSDKSLRGYGLVEAWRRARADDGQLARWQRTGGPNILSILAKTKEQA